MNPSRQQTFLLLILFSLPINSSSSDEKDTDVELPSLPTKCHSDAKQGSVSRPCGCSIWSRLEGWEAWQDVKKPGVIREDCETTRWYNIFLERKLAERPADYFPQYFIDSANDPVLLWSYPGSKKVKLASSKSPKRDFILHSTTDDTVGIPHSGYVHYIHERYGAHTCTYLDLQTPAATSKTAVTASSKDESSSTSTTADTSKSKVPQLSIYLFHCLGADFCCSFNTTACCYEIRTSKYKLGMASIALIGGTVLLIAGIAVFVAFFFFREQVSTCWKNL